MSEEIIKYSWVETHKELVAYLAIKENNQKELIDLLKSVGITMFNDKISDTETIGLEEIDPFTFFCYIYKYGPSKRLFYLQEIAKKLNLTIPTDDSGIPSANAQQVWLFPYKIDRKNNEISRLWNFFKSAISNSITDEQFKDVLTIKGTGKTKITEALFDINPIKYFPINGPSKPYLKKELGIDSDFNSYNEYIEILNKIKSKKDIPFYELSFEAWKWNNAHSASNYWIFQGNPKIYDVVSALKDNALNTWSVKAHVDKIKEGDKIILWLTGKETGCYALGEVISEVFEGIDEESQKKYYVEQDKNEFGKRVSIYVTHNMSTSPILKEEIENVTELKELKVGNQGTNFAATKEQYETILDLVNSTSNSSYKLVIKNLDQEKLKAFLTILRNFIKNNNLQPDDKRISFNVRENKNRLVFLIGSRYTLGIQRVKNKTELSFISKESLSSISENFTNQPGIVDAYWNTVDSFEGFEDKINEGLLIELERSYTCPYRRLNNQEFINDVYQNENINIMNYYPELMRFLKQAKTTDQSYKSYQSIYDGLKVKAKFGQGALAEVPWIAFLNDTDTVQSGIYPVYLYYKKHDLLILAYGVSETYHSNREWNIDNKKSITQYFNENNLGKPKNYGSSYVFRIYDTKKELTETEINNDLNKLISIYKAIAGNLKPNSKSMEEFNHKSFYDAANGSGYFINERICTRFIASLITKPFVILTGLSGSGKTKLAQAFAMWICEDDKQYCIVPVGADWTNREPLLGFPNALEKNNYVKPDNGVLDLIIEANKNESKPYFLILDEMNLSHVERYFADFLSVMESKDEKGILLHSDKERRDTSDNIIPNKILFPKNLFIIGTVNIDETTYMFSPKVLDRASVIEFRVTEDEMGNYLQSNVEIKLDNLKSEGKKMAESFVVIAKDISLVVSDNEELRKTLMSFFAELKKTGAEFGYRSASEITRFATVANKLDSTWSMVEIIDAAIMQKLLPKVHGSRKRLAPVLEILGSLCMIEKLKDGEKMEHFLNPPDEKDFSSRIKYPMSFEKISRMYRALLHNGFTSYAEA